MMPGWIFAFSAQVRDVSPFTTEIIVVNNMQTPLLVIEAGGQTPQRMALLKVLWSLPKDFESDLVEGMGDLRHGAVDLGSLACPIREDGASSPDMPLSNKDEITLGPGIYGTSHMTTVLPDNCKCYGQELLMFILPAVSWLAKVHVRYLEI